MQNQFRYCTVANQIAMFGGDVSHMWCKLQSCDSSTFEYQPNITTSAMLCYFKQLPKVTPTEEKNYQCPEKKENQWSPYSV